VIAGVDGCKGGWIVAVAAGWPCSDRPSLYFRASFAEVLDVTASCAVVVVDIPIGLPADGACRACDRAAQARLGRDRAKVFDAPPRSLLCAEVAGFKAGYLRRFGRRSSAQRAALVPRIHEVDRCMSRALQDRVMEFHPELAWAERCPGVTASKHSAAGLLQRMRALRSLVPGLEDLDRSRDADATRAGRLDDVLDALIGLPVAADIVGRRTPCRRLPASEPDIDAQSLRMEIWY
jgi:predicted RNase H-like nuclease